MTTSDVLNFNRELLEKLLRAGIRLGDVEYIELYNDYTAMFGGGEKVSYIVAMLAERYHVSERKVYSLVKRFGSECNPLIYRGGVIFRGLKKVLHGACSVIRS